MLELQFLSWRLTQEVNFLIFIRYISINETDFLYIEMKSI